MICELIDQSWKTEKKKHTRKSNYHFMLKGPLEKLLNPGHPNLSYPSPIQPQQMQILQWKKL